MPRSLPLFASLLISLTAWLVSGCGGGGKDDPYTLSTTDISVTAKIKGSPPPIQIVHIGANGTGAERPAVSSNSPTIAGIFTTDTASTRDLHIRFPLPEELGIGTHHGTISVSSSEMSATIAVTYTIEPGEPAISGTTPGVLVTGRSEPLVINGSGFSRIAGTPIVSVGSHQISAQVVNDKELKLLIPPLPPGSYPISISASGLSFPSQASLVVAAGSKFQQLTTADVGRKSKVVVDAARGAYYYINFDSNTIHRHIYVAGGGIAVDDSVSLAQPQDFSLSADGSRLYVGRGGSNGEGVFFSIDTTVPAGGMTATVLADNVGLLQAMSFDPAFDPSWAGPTVASVDRVEVLSEGRIVLVANQPLLYDSASNSYTNLRSSPSQYPSPSPLAARRIYTSDPLGKLQYFDSATLSLVDAGLQYSSALSDATGSSVIAVESTPSARSFHLYDDSGVAKGTVTVPVSSIWQDIGATLTPDGRRLYVFNVGSSTLTAYDLATPNGAGGFAVISTQAITATSPVTLASSADGAVFVADNSGVQVIIVP